MSKHVRAWLYYFMMRIIVYSGRPKGPFINQLPEQMQWNGEYQDKLTEGITILETDYDPEEAEKKRAEVLQKHKKSDARASRYRDQLRKSVISHEPTVEELPPAVQPSEVQSSPKKTPKVRPFSSQELFDKVQAIDTMILKLRADMNANNKDDKEKEIRILSNAKMNLFDEMEKRNKEKSGFIPGATDECYSK